MLEKKPSIADGHIKDAVNIPLNNLTDPGSMANIEETHNMYTFIALVDTEV
jgi:hydroxyacylglutathione hydrolase